jgi:hypothetical protein
MPRYINLYLVERKCGGPEEGGWYYEHFTCLASVDYTEAGYAEVAEAVKIENESRRPLSSVLSTGIHIVLVEEEPGQTETKQVPIYA